MSLAKRDKNLATAGLAAATVLVFGATAAFAATANHSAPKSRTVDQFSHEGAAYGGADSTGAGTGSGYGLGPHGDQTVKDATGQWVEQVWQTGKVEAVGAGELKVTDVTGVTWEWTVSATARVATGGADGTTPATAADGSLDAVQVGDSVTVEGTESGTAHTATDVTDHGAVRSQ